MTVRRRAVAVNDAALDLHAGQLALLMGPSGSGKSTLLAILSGLLSPDSGQVLTLGEDLWAMSEKRARALPTEAFRLHLPGLQPLLRAHGPAAAGDGGPLG